LSVFSQMHRTKCTKIPESPGPAQYVEDLLESYAISYPQTLSKRKAPTATIAWFLGFVIFSLGSTKHRNFIVDPYAVPVHSILIACPLF
jgi:hypothetical protein